jgi:hypothetical protein
MTLKLNVIGPNQTEIITNTAIVFFSYNTPVAAQVGSKWYRTDQFHSVTTSRHINKWLDGRKCEEKPQAYFDNLLDNGGPNDQPESASVPETD